MKTICLAILGPTASGKSAFALQIAEALNGEIICLDSTTIYKGFDIGSSKPTLEDRKKVSHHLVDILEPDAPFSAGHFVKQSEEAMEDITRRRKLPIIVGGTYFYLRALQNGMYPISAIPNDVIESVENDYTNDDEDLNTQAMHKELTEKDPASAKNIHPNDRYRLVRALGTLRTGVLPSQLKATAPLSSSRLWLKYAMTGSRHRLSLLIQQRTDEMLQKGLVNEVRSLKDRYPTARALQSIGYREACRFIDGVITEKQLRNEIIEKTRQLAKRQITWLRSDYEVRYVDSRDADRIKLEVDNLHFVLKGEK